VHPVYVGYKPSAAGNDRTSRRCYVCSTKTYLPLDSSRPKDPYVGWVEVDLTGVLVRAHEECKSMLTSRLVMSSKQLGRSLLYRYLACFSISQHLQRLVDHLPRFPRHQQPPQVKPSFHSFRPCLIPSSCLLHSYLRIHIYTASSCMPLINSRRPELDWRMT
jgi:hypothetical protein